MDRPIQLCGDEAQLYEDYAERLVRRVAHDVRAAPLAIIEDACAITWVRMLRRDDLTRERIWGWLVVTARYEALHILDAERRAQGVDVDTADVPACSSPLDELLTLETLRETIRCLPADPRRAVMLQAAGFTTPEIARLTRRSAREVRRDLARARIRLQAMRRSAR